MNGSKATGREGRRGKLLPVALTLIVALTTVPALPESVPGLFLLPRATVTDDEIVCGRLTVLLMLIAFAFTFVVTRLYTRGARAFGWPSGKVGAVHVHHLVVGIITVLLCALMSIGFSPGGYARDAIAVAFGAGAALTLDEFALWLHLKDVYWAPEGRISVDAILLGDAAAHRNVAARHR